MSTLAQERYGKRRAPRRTRLYLLLTGLVALVISVGYITWAALILHPEVNWQTIGYDVQSPSRTTVTFEVTFTLRGHHSGRPSAICTVQALNEETTEVGRLDVRVNARADNRAQVVATLPTSELATTGTVEQCVLAGS